MTIKRAWKIIGNQPTWAIKNMIKALSMLPALNTPQDFERLTAAKIALKNPNPRYT
tara:strand:- start:2156 stop:2323 length:168 start_codon:yes stop_codon:yes gene_type:complete